MKQKLKVALFVGVMLGAGLNPPVQATTAKKTEHHAAKKAVVVKAKEVEMREVSYHL